MCDTDKNDKKAQGDENMGKTIKNNQKKNVEARNISEILGKGIKRYDKALEKLSKN